MLLLVINSCLPAGLASAEDRATLIKQANAPISNLLQIRLQDSYAPAFQGVDGQMTFDWETHKQTLPVDLGVGRVFNIGPQVVNCFIERHERLDRRPGTTIRDHVRDLTALSTRLR